MKRIVAATDLSAWSHYALERAAQLARARSAELDVVHVPSHGRWPQGEGLLDRYIAGLGQRSLEDDRAQLERETAGLSRRFKVKPRCHVLPGRAAEEIAAFASSREVDLVVLGTRGHGRLRPQAVGGTALKVVWQSLLPVLLVRHPADDVYRRMLIATDLGERAGHVARTALEWFPRASTSLLHAFRGEHETTLQLLGATTEAQRRYVVDTGTEAATAFEAFADGLEGEGKRKVERLLAHGHPMPAILKAATELDADLVVLGKHAGAQWEERVLGSVVQNLLQQLKTDILLVP